ncbi:MAG: CGLD27 family protein [Thermosynechococcaceae cyanobacterium MS004]|nr:CGLD27 family protein [Thermosynechococcaceae cyanobacterium MS004]
MAAPVTCCPVPADQLPVNEYKSLQESWFFKWSSADSRTFLAQLGIFWSLGWIITGPIAASSFDPIDSPIHFLLSGGGGSFFLLGLVLLRLYLGWSYVHQRLYCETVDYEETGWYDGQTWEKPPQDLAQDRLISTYQVQPILQRLKYCFGTLGLLSILGTSLWQWF